MRHYKILLLLAALLGLWSCSDEPDGPGSATDSIRLLSSEAIVLDAAKNSSAELTIEADAAWRGQCDAEWLTLTPMTGNAGRATIRVIARSHNNTGAQRTAHITLSTAAGSITVPISQNWDDVFNMDTTTYVVPADGGDLSIRFSTNIHGRKVLYCTTAGVTEWIKPVHDANLDVDSVSAAPLEKCEYIIHLEPNRTHAQRQAEFTIAIVDEAEKELIRSPQIIVRQEGLPVGTSTSWAQDGTVQQVLAHTRGQGFPIVLMGDGFIDADIESGYYQQVMTAALDHLFTEQPMTSFRDAVDAYIVNVVSKNNAFGYSYQTALNCNHEEGTSSIRGEFGVILDYIKKAPQMDNDDRLGNVLCLVILNSARYGGTTNYAISLGDKMSEMAIVYVPIIDGDPYGERFRRVVCHESLGHGIGKLLDEYSYENYSTISQSDVKTFSNLQNAYGWCQNISFSGTKVPWQDLINSHQYDEPDAFGQKLGIYAGGCGYMSGAWRPCDESMMRNNIDGFNPPSRRAIWQQLSRVTEGPTWKYTLQKFLDFDRDHLPLPADAGPQALPAAPSFIIDCSTAPPALPHPVVLGKRAR